MSLLIRRRNLFKSVSTSLLAYWPFNGNANDESGNGYDGTINGTVALTSDRDLNPNTAYNFDGADSTASISIGQFEVFQELGVSCWFKFDANKRGYVISNRLNTVASELGNFIIYKNNSNEILVAFWYTDETFEIANCGTIIDTSWHHIAFSADLQNGGNIRVRLDDVEVFNSNFTKAVNFSTYNFIIGNKSFPSGINETHDGDIDDIYIFNKILTNQEMTDLFNA